MDNCVSALALGMFDGVHIGHKSLLRKATDLASSIGGESGAFTFTNHPCEIFGKKPVLLTSMRERDELLHAEGIRRVIAVPFTKEFASMEPVAFLDYLMETISPDYLVCGFNYTFGAGGKGDASFLDSKSGAYGYRVYEVPPVLFEGLPVSSTRIRSCVESGRMEEAALMLGRPYNLTGKFDRSGVFIPDAARAVPVSGTYAVRIVSEDGSGKTLRACFDHGSVRLEGTGIFSGPAEMLFIRNG